MQRAANRLIIAWKQDVPKRLMIARELGLVLSKFHNQATQHRTDTNQADPNLTAQQPATRQPQHPSPPTGPPSPRARTPTLHSSSHPLSRPVCPSSPDSTPLPTLRADGAASPVPTSTSLPLSFRCAAGPRRRHDPPNLHRSSSHLQPRIIPPYAIQRRLPPRLDPRPTTASMEPIAANTPMISRR